MSFTLFPYQISFRDQLRESLRTHRRVIACLPTGGGKTKIFVTIARDAIEKGWSVLVLSESITIASQIRGELGASGAESESEERAGQVETWMAQTLIRRPTELDRFAGLKSRLLIIADEAHIGTHSRVLNQLPDAFLLGFTATPDYRVAKHLPKIYQSCVVGAQVNDLIQLSRLTPYRHFERRGAKLNALIKIAGEYSEASQRIAFDSPESLSVLVQDIRTRCEGRRKVMIYCASIASCESVAAAFRDAGLVCNVVHSKNPNSEQELKEFEENGRICISVASLTKGYDFPALDCIVLYRKTTSLALYLQIIGRGGRVMPDKSDFLVLDYGANGSEFGRWDMDRDWANMWQGKERKKGIAGAKLCKNCLALNSTSAPRCVECGTPFPVGKKSGLGKTELVELGVLSSQGFKGRMISTLTAQELHDWGKTTKKSRLAWRVARTRGLVSELAKIAGYSQGWVRRQMDEEKGFKDFRV